jgi:hypothetical protein
LIAAYWGSSQSGHNAVHEDTLRRLESGCGPEYRKEARAD